MNDNNITKHKSIESIFKRVKFRMDRYMRTVVFDYSPTCEYQLQTDLVKLEIGEHPIFESYNKNGYVLLSTHYLYSIILDDKESPLLVKNQLFKVKIEDLIYYKSLSELIEEKDRRTDYTECVIKFIETSTEQGGVLLYLSVGVDEYLFHETLRQLVSMNNLHKRQ